MAPVVGIKIRDKSGAIKCDPLPFMPIVSDFRICNLFIFKCILFSILTET